MINIIKLISSIIFSLTLSGCFHSSNENNSFETELEGFWESDCIYMPSSDAYLKRNYEFNGRELVFNEYFMEDSNCSMPVFSLNAIGNFDIGQSIILSSGNTVNSVNITFNNWFLAPGSSNTVIRYNANIFCDKSDWILDEKFDITNCGAIDRFGTEYDIYKLENDKISFGFPDEENDKSSEEDRPVELEDLYYFKSI